MTLTVGIHSDVPMSDYLAEQGASAGTLWRLLSRSPAHARYDRDHRDDSAASDIGTAVHQLVLGGNKAIEVVDAPDWRTKNARELRDAAREAGKLPLLAHQMDNIHAVAKSVSGALDRADIDVRGARREHSMIWDDAGARCRGRPDAIAEKVVVDLKTTTNAEPSAWLRSCMISSGYHIQAAHYLRGLEILGEPHRDFVFAVVEVSPPYACSLIGVSPAMLGLAQDQHRVALARWQECLASGDWPGYSQHITWAEPPSYATYAWEMRQEQVKEPDWMRD